MSAQPPMPGRREAWLPLARESLGAQATNRLRELIRSGDLTPGSRLIETDLAELLGISRGPVREALRNLEQEGLAIISPSRGAAVAEWDSQDLLDLYDVRTPLEIQAISRTIERAAQPCAAELTALLGEWRQAAERGDHDRCADFDFDFHRTIWRHARNRRLSDALERLIAPIQTIFYLNAARYDDLPEVVARHDCLRDVIVAGDLALARELMTTHLTTSAAKARRHSESVPGRSPRA